MSVPVGTLLLSVVNYDLSLRRLSCAANTALRGSVELSIPWPLSPENRSCSFADCLSSRCRAADHERMLGNPSIGVACMSQRTGNLTPKLGTSCCSEVHREPSPS